MNAIFDIHGVPLTRAFRDGIEAALKDAAASEDDVRLWYADLKGVCISSLELQGVDLAGAHLAEAALVGCSLEAIGFDSIEAPQCIFQGTSFFDCRFRRANLVGANFAHCDFRSVFFEHADLRDADFRHARLTSYVNLSGAKLANPHHWLYWHDSSIGQFACLDDQIRWNGRATKTMDEWFHHAGQLRGLERARLMATLTHLQHQRNLWATHEFRPRVESHEIAPTVSCDTQPAQSAG